MNWTLVLLAATAAIAGPVVAGVVAPGAMTELAEGGAAVGHRHFVFEKTSTVRHGGTTYDVTLVSGDLYELPLTTQLVMRGFVSPAPSDADLQAAIKYALDKYDLPVLGHAVDRDGEAITIKATLPAGVLARLSPEYQRVLAQYEA